MQVPNHTAENQPESFATEGTRRVTGVAKDSISATPPDPEVPAKAQRRLFSKAYKLRVLDLWDKCTRSGDKSALLRREGLYSQTVLTWLKQRQSGVLTAATKPINTETFSPADKQKLMRLELENEKLKANLARAEKIIDLQKKIAELLDLPPLPETDRR